MQQTESKILVSRDPNQLLLEQLAQQLGMAAIQPEQDGHYTLYFDDVRVEMISRHNFLCFQSRVCTCVDDHFEQRELLAKLLKIQAARMALPWRSRETLTIDPSRRYLLLFRIVTTDNTEVLEMIEALEGFVTAAEFWRNIGKEVSNGVA